MSFVPADEGPDAPDTLLPPAERGALEAALEAGDLAPGGFRAVRHGPLALAVPCAWDDRSLVTFMERAEEGFRHSVVIGVEPVDPQMTLDFYVRAQITSLIQKIPGLRATRPVAREGFPAAAREVVISWTNDRGAKIRQLMVFFLHRGSAYTATFSAQGDAFDTWRAKVFEPILRSFELGSPPSRP